VWLEVTHTLSNTFPTLFDSFTNPDDARLHLQACVEAPVLSSYVDLMAKCYQRQPDLFKTNTSQIYIAIEKLVLQNKMKEAEYFTRNVITTHFNLITDLEELLHMLIRICPLVNIESQNYFCENIISSISYELTKKKSNKKFAGLFFDLILAILDLTIIEAPPCAARILNIADFYPWKQLDKQLTHLIQSCVAYDKIVRDSHFSKLDTLEDILKFIRERATANITILHATHESALQAVFKWSTMINNDTGKLYDKHVFKMGELMTELIDRKQITVDICSRFLEILQRRIDNNDEIYETKICDQFLTVSLFMTKYLFISLFFSL